MSLDPIRRFVETEAFGGSTCVTGILHRLRVYDHQRCPFTFFLA
jgi:hypothetical protein